DGMSPRMQMYVWSGLAPHTLTINSVAYYNDTAQFGPATFDVTANVQIANPADGCNPIANAAGKIVLVDRGTCTFVQEAQAVQNAGGVGMIVDNNVSGPVGQMGGTGATLPPSLAISMEDGATVKGLLGAGTVSAHMFQGAAGVRRDGDIDTTVVSHEWG